MLLNTYQVNDALVNGELQSSANELLLYIEKDIEFRASADSESILSIEKRVKALASGNLLEIEKRIVLNATSFYSRNGWEPILTLGGLTIDASILTGLVRVTKSENDSHTAQFSVILTPATYTLYTYQGKEVTIKVRKSNTVYTVFTGIVDVPVVDAINEKLTLNCIANRQTLLDNFAHLLPGLGFYSENILGINSTVASQLDARMSTIPYSADLDGRNNLYFTSWTPKASADYSYGSSDVYRRDPSIQIESAAKLINSIDISLTYSYQRLHHRYASYVWEHTYCPSDITTGTGGVCAFLSVRPSMPTKEMIRSAAQSTGWPLQTALNFGRIFASGTYQCSGVYAGWSTYELGFNNIALVDSAGNAVNDSNGNQLYQSILNKVEDNADLYTMYADWKATTRYSQNIQEVYTITVNAPTSETIYSTIETKESYTVTDADQHSSWEAYPQYTTAPSGVTIVGNSAMSYYFDGATNRSSFNSDYLCAINKAKTTILSSHRDTTISFERNITPELELWATVALTGRWINAKGKCKQIIHNMCVSDCEAGTAGEAFTSVQLAQYRGVGSTSETALAVTTPPTDSTAEPANIFYLQTHLGEDPSQAAAANWTGYVGNIARTVNNNFIRTAYQESFIVPTPEITAEYRNNKILTKSVTYSINIPIDSTTYTSYG